MSFGIKISKPGFDVGTCSDFNLIFSSKYDIFRISTTGTGTFNTGGSAVINHNLGYSPAYLVYLSTDGTSYYLFNGSVSASSAFSGPEQISIGTDNLVISKQLGSVVNQYNPSDYYSTLFGGTNSWDLGNNGGNNMDTAVRYTGLNLNQGETVTSAVIDVHVTFRGNGTGDLKFKTYGIDEDNTGDFSSYPLGRQLTSAVGSQTQSLPANAPFNFGINVKAELEEICARSGWSNGNAMGFISFNDSSPNNVWVQNLYSDSPRNILTVIKVSSPQTIYYKYVIFENKLGTKVF